MTDKELFQLLKDDPNEGTKKVYKTYRTNFFNWARGRYNLEQSKLADTFQEAVIILFEKIRSGELDELTCSIKTFLFSVARNIILNRFRVENRSPIDGSKDEEKFLFTYNLESESIDLQKWKVEEPKARLMKLVDELDEKCKQILRLFYYRNFVMDAIADELGYKNRDTVKALRFRCLAKLRKITLSQYTLDDF